LRNQNLTLTLDLFGVRVRKERTRLRRTYLWAYLAAIATAGGPLDTAWQEEPETLERKPHPA
jgi:hypothetical protein